MVARELLSRSERSRVVAPDLHSRSEKYRLVAPDLAFETLSGLHSFQPQKKLTVRNVLALLSGPSLLSNTGRFSFCPNCDPASLSKYGPEIESGQLGLAVLSGIKKSPAAFAYVAEAKTRCDRNIRQLRRRLTRCIAQLCRHMSNTDLIKVADYATLISA